MLHLTLDLMRLRSLYSQLQSIGVSAPPGSHIAVCTFIEGLAQRSVSKLDLVALSEGSGDSVEVDLISTNLITDALKYLIFLLFLFNLVPI